MGKVVLFNRYAHSAGPEAEKMIKIKLKIRPRDIEIRVRDVESFPTVASRLSGMPWGSVFSHFCVLGSKSSHFDAFWVKRYRIREAVGHPRLPGMAC